ncbi:MAG TPA: MMPL family transporter, partial [Vicinamibacteria bacterium]|nr:MMPL family transporter [Vicinamibacteria bacterium]
ARPVLLVLDGVPSPSSPEGQGTLEEVIATVRRAPGVQGTFSYLDTKESFLIGAAGRGTFIVVGLEAPGGRLETVIPSLRETIRSEVQRLKGVAPEASLLVTGEPAINFDLWRTSTAQCRTAEGRSLPLMLGLLFAAFGSLSAAAIPLLVGVLAVVLVLGAASFLSRFYPLSILIVNVASMLGLALGIDYALLTVSRFRESSASGMTPEEAAADAGRHAGGTVAVSGIAVIVGFLALFLVPLNELRSCALGGLLVVLASVLLATTLVPGLLARLGSGIEAGRLLRARGGRGLEAWKCWARWVSDRPLRVLAVSLTPLVALAFQGLRLNPKIPRGDDWLPRGMESAEGLRALKAMGRGAVVQSIRVVIELPEDTQALSEEGWQAVRRVEAALGEDARIGRVRSLGSLAGDRASDLAAIALLPSAAKRTYLSEEGDAALLEAIPREGVDPRDLMTLVRTLRLRNADALTGLRGARLLVGGLPAFNVDYEDAVLGRFPMIVGSVILGTLVVLFKSFRSVLIPLKAVVLNLLSVAAAFGALVLVFQDGWGSRFLGLKGPVDGIFPIIPPLVFCTVFGLSMDYEVFLVARVREARLAGFDEVAAIAEGLGRTGGLITSAASIMVTVFLAFTLGDVIIVKMLGFTLAVAVVLDATVVRMAVGPALLRLAGAWNWWPGAKASEPAETPAGR